MISSQNQLLRNMSSVKIASKNVDVSADDHIKSASERFYASLLIDLGDIVVDYTRECQDGKIDNSLDAFQEYVKLKPYVAAETATGTKVGAGKATSLIRQNGGSTGTRTTAAKGKELSDAP